MKWARRHVLPPQCLTLCSPKRKVGRLKRKQIEFRLDISNVFTDAAVVTLVATGFLIGYVVATLAHGRSSSFPQAVLERSRDAARAAEEEAFARLEARFQEWRRPNQSLGADESAKRISLLRTNG